MLRWWDLARRKHYKYDNLCIKCLNNLIQNDPEKLEQNKNNSKLLWCNSDYRIQCLKAFELHNKRMQLNPEYANKHRRRSNSVTGTVLIAGQQIVFDSAFELIFLWSTKDRYTTIRRCNFAIAYGGHFYHPDFFVIDKCGDRIIIEIKGFYQHCVAEKQKAAEQYIAATGIADFYVLYDTDRLFAESILDGIGGGWMWKQIREISNEAIITFADQKHKRIAEIGISRFRRENKNKEHIQESLCW